MQLSYVKLSLFLPLQGDVHPPHDDDPADGDVVVDQPHPRRHTRPPHPRLRRHLPRGEREGRKDGREVA